MMVEHRGGIRAGPPRLVDPPDPVRALREAEHQMRPRPPSADMSAAPTSDRQVLWLQRTVGNHATSRLVGGAVQHGRVRVQRGSETAAPAAGVTPPSPVSPASPATNGSRVAFVREEGLNLRTGPNQSSTSLAQLTFGTRVRVLEEEALHPAWQKVATPAAAVGFLYAPRVHFPPPDLIARDPALTMIKVRTGQTFWGLVKQQYGIQGNESTADQNINHFINAIRAVNKTDAFIVDTDWLDDIGNWAISGRDASDTLLKAGYDLWIPSFGVAAAMDVGSGTVTGEVTRIVKKIEQKIDDFRDACSAAVKYMPEAITRHAGDTAMGLLTGLIDFAIDAAKILAVSTAVGALLGAVFGGGVGAVPGAEIGFEIGLLILDIYGLGMLVEAIVSMAGSFFSELGSFISQVWNANGDPKKVDNAGKTLAEAIGIFVSALLVALAAYLMKKGGEKLAKTKFGAKIGQSEIAKWLVDRQKLKTTREKLNPKEPTAEVGKLPRPRMTIAERLQEFFKRLGQQPKANSADEALGQVNRTLTAVEDDLSGVVRKDPPPPPNMPDGRMYPPLEDNIVRNSDGSITARTRGHTIQCGADGSITITNRKTGNVDFHKP
jgi:hypothetical protein